MRFGNASYFWILLAIPVFIALFIWLYQTKQKILHKFASPAIINKLTSAQNQSRQILKFIMFLFFFLFMVLALVRPKFGIKTEMVERRGVDIMIALDISRSMMAEDVVPNRLDRAKHEISKFINMLRGDRVGLVIFAGASFVQCPLTLDYSAANMFLDAVDCNWIDVQGTNFSDAIDRATGSFTDKKSKGKILIILSDGENHDGDVMESIKDAVKKGIKIYTIGIGSEHGVPIPIHHRNGNVVYKKDQNGNLVMTKLNPVMLEEIALAGNGSYFSAGTNLDLIRIYNEISKMEKNDFGTSKMTSYEERYQIFLFIAIVFLLIEFFIPESNMKKTEWRGRFE